MGRNTGLHEEDDGRVIADMSGIDRPPLLIPDASALKRVREHDNDPDRPGSFNAAGGPEVLDKEGRRAMMGGAISAMLLAGGIIFAAFAIVILIIGHLL